MPTDRIGNLDPALIGSEMLLKASTAWRHHFTEAFTEERSWLIFFSLQAPLELEGLPLRNLAKAFVARFNADGRATKAQIAKCEAAGWISFDSREQLIHATDKLTAAYRAYSLQCAQGVIATAAELEGFEEGLPHPELWSESLQRALDNMWDRFSNNWRTAIEIMLQSTDQSPSSQAIYADRFFTASHWFLFTYLWRHEHRRRIGERSLPMKRDRLREKLLGAIRSSVAATDARLRTLASLGLVTPTSVGRRAAFNVPDPVYEALKESFEAYAKDLQIVARSLLPQERT